MISCMSCNNLIIMIKALFSLASELMFFPGCISYLPSRLPWGSEAVTDAWVWRGSAFSNLLAHGARSLFEFSPFPGDFQNVTANPWADTIKDVRERAETQEAPVQPNHFWGRCDPKRVLLCLRLGSSCLSLRAAMGYSHRAAPTYARAVLAWQVLAPRPSAYGGNPTSARADHVWQGEGKGEQSLLGNSWLPAPCSSQP